MFDTARFLEENFGTPDAVVGLASAHGYDMAARDTVRKWFARGAVSGEWFPVLLLVLEAENGRPANLSHYAVKGTGHDIFA